MIWDICNTMLEFASIYLIFCAFSGEKVFDKDNTLLYVLLGGGMSVFFCIDIPHYLFLNIILLILVQGITFRKVEIGKRYKYATAAVLITLSMEMMIYSFLPLIVLQTLLGDSIVNIIMVISVASVNWGVAYYKLNRDLGVFVERYYLLLGAVLGVWSLLTQVFLERLGAIWSYIPGTISLGILVFTLLGIIIDIANRRSEEHHQIEMYEERQRILEEFVEQLRKDNHDYKHQLSYIKTNIEMDHNKVIEDYINNLLETDDLMDSILALNNRFLRTVVYQCYMQCKKKGIEFVFNSTGMLPAFPLEEYKLVRIVENLVANAIEYSESLYDQHGIHGYVSICLYADQNENSISIANKYIEKNVNVMSFFSKNYSTKDKTKHSGIGLTNVKELLRGTDLVLAVKNEEEILSFTVSYTMER